MTKEELLQKKVSAISLGCDKNRVDLERMLFALKDYGFTLEEDIADANIIIVNTCAFIESACDEAIENILLALKQKSVICEKVVITGCLVERFKDELKELFPEVDKIINVKDNNNLVNYIEELYEVEDKSKLKEKDERVLTTPGHYAFLKIADGCNNGCAYCTIPRIRGRYKSVPMEKLIKEAKYLSGLGVKELIIVAQDTTRYGEDLYKTPKLIDLLTDLVKIKGIEWIRLHYLYPEMLDENLLEFIKNNDKICKYIDVPFQHINETILKNMNRKSTNQQIKDLLNKLKTNYPEITIRSTFIVGFPQESRKQFNELCLFLKEYKLDNVGFFPFYKEEKTKAFFMHGQISNFTKKRRLKKIQNIQTKIATEKNNAKIGLTERVIVDRFDTERGVYFARSQNNSPDVDFYVILEEDNNTRVGEFYNIKLTDYESGYFKGEKYEFTK